MKKIYAVLLLLILIPLLFLLKTNVSFAQTQRDSIRDVKDLVSEQENNSKQDYNPQNLNLGTNPDVPVNLSTYTQSVFIEITSATSCLLSGVDPIRPDKPCLGFDPSTRKLGYVENNGGALGLMGGIIAATFDIPASSGDYIRYLAGNFGISQKTDAASLGGNPCIENPTACEDSGNSDLSFGTGNGFDGLRPLLGIWTAMRNLVYLLFVLVFIVLGLGIMFRIQIDPRAVLSIQNQLPKIIIALVLVTFSYAIAGFLIDMMYLSLFLIINLFQAQGLETSTTLDTNPINAAGGLGGGGIGGIAANAAKGITSAMSSLFDGSAFPSVIKKIINFIVNPVGAVASGVFGGIPVIGSVSNTINNVVSGALDLAGIGLSNAFAVIVGAIAWVIILIALLSALFRLWFTLIKTYVFILINVTFAPIWIAFGLFPGSSLSFGNWIRSLVSNLAAFPLVLILFSLGRTLQNGFESSGSNSFVPPYIGDPGNMNAFSSIIGMGIILLAPEAVNMAKAALKAPESKFTSSIGRSLGVGQGIVGKGLGSVKNAAWYTNPRTGESGRLKAYAGEKASQGLQKIPGVGGIYTKFRDKFSTPEGRKERRDKETAREAAREEERKIRESQGGSSGQSARRGIVGRLAGRLTPSTQRTSQTRPITQESSSSNTGNAPSNQGGEAQEPENNPSSENPPEENEGGQGPTTT